MALSSKVRSFFVAVFVAALIAAWMMAMVPLHRWWVKWLLRSG